MKITRTSDSEMMFFKISVLVLLSFICVGYASIFERSREEIEEMKPIFEKFDQSFAAVKTVLKQLQSRWDIARFPKFLKAASISHTAWEVLKLKFEDKILHSILGQQEKFVVSFLGSSVTAGHDSLFNVSFPVLTGKLLEMAMSPMGIIVESRNAAMGNNPCLPYDLCPRAFAGNDSDIVHWEQSYNCFGTDSATRPVFEQFIRQSLKIPTKPVVIFSDSSTPNWKEEDCKDKKTSPPSLSQQDSTLVRHFLDGDILKIVSEINTDISSWSALSSLFKDYKVAGIQLWNHGHYESYRCRGPYVPKWGCCSASWHPSVLGHELRAAHYAYIWIEIYQEALKDALHLIRERPKRNGKSITLTDVSNIVHHHILKEEHHFPEKPLYDEGYPEEIHCYTSFQPIFDQSLNIRNLVIPQLNDRPFEEGIMEDFIDKGIVAKARSQGYLDYKSMLYGDNSSAPLSLRVVAKSSNKIMLCQPPGNWGQLPDGFGFLWLNAQFFLTKNVGDYQSFKFDKEKALKLSFKLPKPKDSQSVCIRFNEIAPAGNHVLTIRPTSSKKIMISYILLP